MGKRGANPGEITRRDALAASAAVAIGSALPTLVTAQREQRSESKLRRILSRMTLADKVGQLLMAYLDAETLDKKIGDYRCGSLLV